MALKTHCLYNMLICSQNTTAIFPLIVLYSVIVFFNITFLGPQVRAFKKIKNKKSKTLSVTLLHSAVSPFTLSHVFSVFRHTMPVELAQILNPLLWGPNGPLSAWI